MTQTSNYSKFETELSVRPDDIDMNNHVHFSKYLDYVLAARYDQLKRYYKMSMDEFLENGLSWVVKECKVEYKRPLLLGDTMIVRTWIAEVESTSANVAFEIIKKSTKKTCAIGVFKYTLINTSNGRAEKIPPKVIEKYSI